MEIERKWLLRRLPAQHADAMYWVERFYLSTDPEVRLRRCKPNGTYEDKSPYVLTIKRDGTLSREEIETAVTEEFYESALDIVNLSPIQEHCLLFNHDGHVVEISILLNNEQYICAEVEFSSEEEAKAYEFPWPELVEKEVTEDPYYKMKNYWKRIKNQ